MVRTCSNRSKLGEKAFSSGSHIVLSLQTPKIRLPSWDMAICGQSELPTSFARIFLPLNLFPLYKLALKYASPFPIVLSIHNTWILSFATEILRKCEKCEVNLNTFYHGRAPPRETRSVQGRRLLEISSIK